LAGNAIGRDTVANPAPDIPRGQFRGRPISRRRNRRRRIACPWIRRRPQCEQSGNSRGRSCL